jgi:hypothetical protein
LDPLLFGAENLNGTSRQYFCLYLLAIFILRIYSSNTLQILAQIRILEKYESGFSQVAGMHAVTNPSAYTMCSGGVLTPTSCKLTPLVIKGLSSPSFGRIRSIVRDLPKKEEGYPILMAKSLPIGTGQEI